MKTIKWINIGLLVIFLFYGYCSREQIGSDLHNSEKEREKLTQQLEDKDKELEKIKAEIDKTNEEADQDKQEADDIKEEQIQIVYVPSKELIEKDATIEEWKENYKNLEKKYDLSEKRSEKLESAVEKKDQALRLARLKLSLKYEEMFVIQDAIYSLLQKDHDSLKIKYQKLKDEKIIVGIGPAAGVTPQGEPTGGIMVTICYKLKGYKLPRLLRWIK